MTFLSKLFGSKVTCPRCQGKGFVDMNDIHRLNMELKWKPGTCAYCEGIGKVSEGLDKKIPVNESYLNLDLPKVERALLRSGDPHAFQRSKQFEQEHENFITQALYLYNTGKLTTAEIAEFYLIPTAEKLRNEGTYSVEKNDLITYLEKLISK